MLEFRNPLPVTTELGDGYALYVTSSGPFENDLWTVILDSGDIRHFATNQLKYVGNATLDIARPKVG